MASMILSWADSTAKVHAYTGAGVRLWEYDTGAMGIAGKPAVGDIDGDGLNEIVIGAGNNLTLRTHGGLYVLNDQGRLQCSFTTGDANRDSYRDGVYSSPALVDLDGNDGGRAGDRLWRVGFLCARPARRLLGDVGEPCA
jgi:outer membrane protein assembly factor BamB